MDLRTVMLLLAIGSYIFGLLLVLFKFNKNDPQQVPFWISAKLLQATGSLVLYFRTEQFDGLTLFAYITLLLGCAYEAWAVKSLVGNSVDKKFHLSISFGIIAITLLSLLFESPQSSGLIFIIQSILFFLPFVFLISKRKFSLQSVLAICYFLTSLVFLIAGFITLFLPSLAISLQGNIIAASIPIVSYFIFLTSGYILLMLAKEKSDLEVKEMQKTLQKSEIRFKRIIETSIEGILVFDKEYKITFSNNKMATMLGYSLDEMLGRTYLSFFPNDQLDIYDEQKHFVKEENLQFMRLN